VATATLDQDTAEQAALKLTVNGGTPIGAAKASAVPFTVAGLEGDDNGTVSFSDGSHPAVVVNIVNGVPAASTVNLSGLNDGTITATLHLNNDAAGNSFTNVVATATLDQDTAEQATLQLTVNGGSTTRINAASAPKVPFTVSGLEIDDSGYITFSDGQNSVVVTITAGAVVAGSHNTLTTVDLSSLKDGPITSVLTLNNDPAGNTFKPVSGNNVTLTEYDHWVSSFNPTLIVLIAIN
jgi:hypothetical protein